MRVFSRPVHTTGVSRKNDIQVVQTRTNNGVIYAS